MPGSKTVGETPLSSSAPPQREPGLPATRGSTQPRQLRYDSSKRDPLYFSRGALRKNSLRPHARIHTHRPHTRTHAPTPSTSGWRQTCGCFLCLTRRGPRGRPGEPGRCRPSPRRGRCPFARAPHPCWPEPVNHAARSFPSYRSYQS